MAKVKAKKKVVATEAFHMTDGKNKHVVGVKALQVLLLKDGDGWFAQGLQIDYAACGDSIAAAKKNFETGLAHTIGEHLVMYGDIEKLLKVAPQEAWHEYLHAPADSIKQDYSTIQAIECFEVAADAEVMSSFPFSGIEFIEKQPSRATA